MPPWTVPALEANLQRRWGRNQLPCTSHEKEKADGRNRHIGWKTSLCANTKRLYMALWAINKMRAKPSSTSKQPKTVTESGNESRRLLRGLLSPAKASEELWSIREQSTFAQMFLLMRRAPCGPMKFVITYRGTYRY